MKIDPRLITALVLAGFSACQIPHDAGDDHVGSAPLAITLSCGAARWIGLTASCTSVGSWTATPLFSGAAPPLDQYCVYEWSGSFSPTPADIATLAGSGAMELAEDCPVVVPQSYDRLLGESLRESLNTRVGTVDTLGVKAVTKAPVRVVVVDTAPNSGDSTEIRAGNDRHGDTLAGVIRDIGCGSHACAVNVVSSLGLPWLDESTRSNDGGHVGRLSDVALAIYDAMELAQNQGEQRVIINLSVGWEDLPGLADCDEAGSMAAPTQAVYDVIQRASCAGALVIAAAGNDAAGPHAPGGMTCPARWEAQSITGCDERDAGPLLYAVGGVDYSDAPIVITRPYGRPRLAAPAVGGIGWSPGADVPSPLTGTSVAAAVASGVAALVWSQRPSLSGEAVMDALYDSGVSAGVADTCPWGTSGPCDAHRISLCSSLIYAGVTGLNCTPPPPIPISSPSLPPAVLAAVAIELSGQEGRGLAAPGDMTSLARYLADSAALSGGVFPQPVVPVCPSCMFAYGTTSSIFYARFTVDVNGAALVLDTSSATVIAPLMTASGSSDFTAGIYTITVNGAPPGVRRAWLTGYTDDGNTVSVTQEVLVWH